MFPLYATDSGRCGWRAFDWIVANRRRSSSACGFDIDGSVPVLLRVFAITFSNRRPTAKTHVPETPGT
ncbi:hypothetical protein GCM10009835_12520 [Planosporangium flavigriseum]|uniref:Uncharacterized protein n=1 Tax=Planosporangium flavigriseum TaxID=373681 RepID=A0A8J3LWR1_9ACTN|nr:hypothetical protein Pfl04_33800 [Planosporangium flavigriseum]